MDSLQVNGFLILREVFSKSELDKIITIANQIIEYAQKNLEDPFAKFYLRHRADRGVLYDVFQRHPEFQSMASNKRILDEIEKVIGEDIYLYVNSFLYKPKGKKNGVPWHQDFLSRPNESTKYIAWIAIDDATQENGCLKVIPGSHQSGFFDWYTIPGEAHHDRVKKEYIDESQAQYVELKAGDVLIFNQYLLHSSDEVHTDTWRRAFRVVYKGLNELEIPRGAPIMLRGGTPKSLERRYTKPYQQPEKNTKTNHLFDRKILFRKVLHKIGRALTKV